MNVDIKSLISYIFTNALIQYFLFGFFVIFCYRIYERIKYHRDTQIKRKVKYIIDYLSKVDVEKNYSHYTTLLHAITERHIKKGQASAWQLGYVLKEITKIGNGIRVYGTHVDRPISDVLDGKGHQAVVEMLAAQKAERDKKIVDADVVDVKDVKDVKDVENEKSNSTAITVLNDVENKYEKDNSDDEMPF